VDPRRQLGIGERAVDFVLPGPSGSPERFYAYAGGRPTVIVFDDGGPDEHLAALADRLSGRGDVALHRVTAERAAEPAAFRTWSDPERTVADAYGLPSRASTAVVLDPTCASSASSPEPTSPPLWPTCWTTRRIATSPSRFGRRHPSCSFRARSTRPIGTS
jgi:hypothetical protein